MEINGLDLFSISHMIILFLTYIYYNRVLDNGFFHFILLLFIYKTWSYYVVRVSNSFPFQFDLKALMCHLCCIMVMLLTKCISCVNHLKAFLDPNLRDTHPCTSPRVSCVNEMRANASTNDLFKREKALEINMGPSCKLVFSISTFSRIDLELFNFYSPFIWSLLSPHLFCLVSSNISLSSTSRRSSRLSSYLLIYDESFFSQLSFPFWISIVPFCSSNLLFHVFIRGS